MADEPIITYFDRSFGWMAKKGVYSHDRNSFRCDGVVQVDLPIWLNNFKKDIPFGETDRIGLEVYRSQALHYGLPMRASKKASRNVFKKEITKQGGTLRRPDHIKAIEKELFEHLARKFGTPDYADDDYQYLPEPYSRTYGHKWPFRWDGETKKEFEERQAGYRRAEAAGRDDEQEEEPAGKSSEEDEASHSGEDSEDAEGEPDLDYGGHGSDEADTSIETVTGKRKRTDDNIDSDEENRDIWKLPGWQGKGNAHDYISPTCLRYAMC